MSDSGDTGDDDGVILNAEMMDRAERKALKDKARKEAEKKAPTQDEIEIALGKTRLAEEQKKKRKNIFRGVLALCGVGILAWGVNYLFTPYEGGMTFGICKVYLELNVQYPEYLELSTVEDFGESVRIWYVQVDGFGEYRMENIQCFFRADETTGAAIDRITINRREVDPTKIAEFNSIIPVILANPPDLTIPYPLPDSLEGLQINTNMFRKPIL